MKARYRLTSLFRITMFLCLLFAAATHVRAAGVLPELENKYVVLKIPNVSTLEHDHWYVMYNVGRKGFLCDDQSKLHISTAPPTPDGMKYLVRITEVKGYQVVQTGLGRYFKYLSTSNNSGSATSASSSNAYTYGEIGEGCFWLKDKNGMVLDANALGSAIDATATVAGWGKDTPTSVTGNNSWKFFPVELVDGSDEFADVPYSFGNFSFETAEGGRYLHLDANNMNLTDPDDEGLETLTAPVCLGIDGTWSLGMPEGSGQKSYFHIGTGGKFSAGPVSPLHLYRVSEVDELGYVYTHVTNVVDGGLYLVVGDYEGAAYALSDVVDSPGTSNQRMLSSKVVFADDGTATLTGAGVTATHHHWRLHYGESSIPEPFVYTVGETGGASGSGKPLLTIACVSDIHTQEGWLSNTNWDDKDNGYYKAKDIKDVRVRESLVEAVKALKGENVDVLIVGGDCQSDATVDEEHWRQVRRLMADELRSVKPAGEDVPVLYVNGNHEYEVASTWGANGQGYYNWRHIRPFNAGEYYEFPMLSDIGVLASDYDCFYEDAPNESLLTTKKTMPVLAAYHYSIKGFDFVVLNCGKHLFHNANNYTYSDESVEWVARKLQQIYADDPTRSKTVFFALHIPFGDSNSININEDKGMSYFGSTHRLKQVLAQYPGLVMLYGHDHGQDMAFIRSKTSQRVTRYDTQGNVMATADGINTFDKDLANGGALKASAYKGQSVMFHPYSGKTDNCLGVKGTYQAGSAAAQRTLALLDTPTACTIFPETDGGISMRLGDGSMHLQYNNGFGITAAEHQMLYLYRVNIDGDSFTLSRVQEVEDGGVYLIASSTHVYRVGGSKTLPAADSYSVSGYNTFFWRAELPEAAEPSFVSSFMGSMRYYANSNGDPANSSQGERKLIQGLIIYVYEDRIVFDMKNFRNKVGNRVRNALTPYVVKRATAVPNPEAVVQHNPSGAYYRRVDDLAQLCSKSVCILVDESRKRSIGMASNSTNKFEALEVIPSGDGRVEVSRNASECEFVLEKKADGAVSLRSAADKWYMRTHDGYIKGDESKIFFRQQSLNYNTSNPLCNEALKGSLVPWTITLNDDGVANVESEAYGPLKKQSVGMTTAAFRIYQKVVPVEIDAATGLAAFYAEHALMMPEGVEAFTVDGLKDDGTLQFVYQPTSLPAKTGVVLRRESQVPGVHFELPVLDDRYAAPLGDCLLGTLADLSTAVPMSGSAAEDEASYRFYRFDGSQFVSDSHGASFVNPAGEAYLVLSASQADTFESAPAVPIKALLDEAVVNGVKDVMLSESVPSNASIYNLNGQRVAAGAASVKTLPSGLYIVGGKKLIVQ